MINSKYIPPEIPGLVFFSNDSSSLNDNELAIYYSTKHKLPIDDIYIYHAMDEGKSKNHIYLDKKHHFFVLDFRKTLDDMIKMLGEEFN